MAEQSEQFIVTARKWRPMQFQEMVGQDHVGITLRNAVTGGRVHHAYLFTGPRGVGKTTTARLLAKSLNCLSPASDGEPCNTCTSCKDIVDGRSLDVVEIDGASNNSVDDVRKLRDNAKYPPMSGKYKVYIIDEVHMLSTSAFNALLKTLEEPPPHILFIFATTEVHKVPATILSRCQRFDFRRMEIETIVNQLKKIAANEKITIDDESLLAIAKKADGSMRDSQSIFDQVIAFCGNNIRSEEVHNALHLIDEEFFFSITKAIRQNDVAFMFRLAQTVNEKGYEVQECLNGLLEHLRNILSVLATGSTKLIESSTVFLERYEREAVHFNQYDIIRLMTLVTNTQQEIRFSAQPRFRFELLLSQMAIMDSSVLISDLLNELKNGATPNNSPNNTSSKNTNVIQQAAISTVQEKTADYKQIPQQNTVQEKVVDPIQHKTQVHAEQKENAAQKEKTITAENIKLQWNTFVENISDTGIKMLFQLSKSNYKIDFSDGEIIIYALQKLFHTSLEKYIPTLEKQLHEFYNVQIIATLKTADDKDTDDMFAIQEVNHAADSSLENKQTTEKQGATTMEKLNALINSAEESKPQKPQKEYHPIEQAIMTMFGAREVPVMK